jgi:GTPase SAR1 family protein
MSVHIIENKEPNLKRPTFSVDGKLDNKLDEYEVTKLMNKSNFTLFLGPAGSGKTSMIVGLLNTKNLFNQVYNTIYLFMGKNSRDSIKGSFFDKKIPSDQIYDELTHETLEEVYDKIRADAEAGNLSLILMDDVQRQMKDKDVEKLLLHIVNNRRHLKTSIWCANQNYINIPRPIRLGLTNIFCWKVKKREIENLLTEQIEMQKEHFNDVLKLCFNEPHDFMFLDANSQRLFSNWNEIIIDE